MAGGSQDRIGTGAVPRLYQRAFEILAGQIERGTLRPGTRLLESAVAGQFGISRAPARQALGELERAGLVQRAAGRGYTVCEPAGPPAAQDAGASAEEQGRLMSSASWQRFYQEVEEEIVARISFAGWRVNEAKLARHYDVSRTVARDVVARLQQRGLVRKDDSSRWYAPALTPDHIAELYELRWLLEPVALDKAAPAVPPVFLAGMRDHLLDALANAGAIDGPTLDQLEQEMHVGLLGYCGNRTLLQAIAQPQSLLIAHRFLYRWTIRLFEVEPFLPEHLEIVERMQAGRIEEAAGALERHLRDSRDRAVARVDAIVREFNAEDLPYLERLAAG